jgi:hypothetical protein
VIETRLDPGEQILWTGQPKHGLLFRPPDLYRLPVTLFGAWFIRDWWLLFRTQPPPFFYVGAAWFVAYLAYEIVLRFLLDWLARARTTYAVTNRRVIIESLFLRRQFTWLDLRDLSDIRLEELGKDKGTIKFGRDQSTWWWHTNLLIAHDRGLAPRFEAIDGAAAVYWTIRDAQDQLLREK